MADKHYDTYTVGRLIEELKEYDADMEINILYNKIGYYDCKAQIEIAWVKVIEESRDMEVTYVGYDDILNWVNIVCIEEEDKPLQEVEND